ncbi:MAG: adenylosuccinate synthetase [Bacteroidales bacterium]|jgi:adenylosuccinate synthase|nr:adenylosuccinate synthetase [Bacteroidales bacterium]
MIDIVLGTAFGDEGKGQCVHSLATSDSLVIRFSGGHQCGHTAVTEQGLRHIFSQFGAGTFRGAATYLSEYCTVFPTAFFNEFEALQSLNIEFPDFYLHPLAMVTTPYDLAFNRALSMITGHGTCGVGFGTTLQRNEDFYHLYVNDLLNPYMTDTKMSMIRRYYDEKVRSLNISSRITYENELETAMNQWNESLSFFSGFVKVKKLSDIEHRFEHYIFEGSQGILLDQHFGFFPHVTRSNTTSINALEMIRKSPVLSKEVISTYYVSRCYQTRHGNGPFPDTETVELVNLHTESNHENDWQGIFRIARLDFGLLQHALNCDIIQNDMGRKILIVTCLDQLKESELFMQEFHQSRIEQLFDEVHFKDRPDWE